ncbi:MAG: MFS transporter [Ectothiorhodospiraceae bacterium]|nr:MFS transporter [Ectothiorhodospiraceae bacterium]
MRSSPRLAVLVLLCAVGIVGLAFGTRQSFGLFVIPISLDMGWGRESFSLVIAVQALLNGIAAPFAGAISDKWGSARTVLAGGALYAAGLAVMSQATSASTMMLGGGLLVGMGISACGMPVLLGAVARVAPAERRSLWLGIVTAGATAGQLAIIPLVQSRIATSGWSGALLTLAGAFALLLPLAACLRSADRQVTDRRGGQSLSEALAEARGHSGYLLLLLGFFVCGFQVQFVATHLPAYIQDQGLGEGLAASALMVIACFNMLGAWTAGYLGGLHRKKYLLSGIYLGRALAIVIFVVVGPTPLSVLVFCAVLGFIWLGTVPLTSGLIAQVFGPRYLSTLFAIVYLSHQAGNFVGAWVGGRVYDATGSYELVWWIAAALGVVAATLHAPIDDRPVARLARAG